MCYPIDNKNLLNSIFKHFTKLDQLVYLNIGGFRDINEVIIGLRQLSNKCLKLKSLDIGAIYPDFLSSALLTSFITGVKKFKALERLGFEFSLEDFSELQTYEEFFNGFESLTHLSILLVNAKQIQNDLLKNINKSLPKLRVLCIKSLYPIEVSEETADCLGRLSRLESIQLNVKNNSIQESIVDKIMKNCRKIKSIDITVDKHEVNSSSSSSEWESDPEED